MKTAIANMMTTAEAKTATFVPKLINLGERSIDQSWTAYIVETGMCEGAFKTEAECELACFRLNTTRGSRVCRPWNSREVGTVLAIDADRNEIEVQLDENMGRVCGPIIHHGSANWMSLPTVRLTTWANAYGTPIRSDCPECHGDGMSRPVEDGYCCVTCQVRHAEEQEQDEEDEDGSEHYDETDMLLDGIL